MSSIFLTLPCRQDKLAGVRDQLGEWLAMNGVDGEARDAVVLATHEALVQTIDRSEPFLAITVEASIGNRLLTIEVTGGGVWSEPESDPDREGFALRLIGSLVDSAEVVADQQTTVRLRKSL